MCGFTPSPLGGGVPESLLAMGGQNIYHLSLLGEGKASCPTGAEITWGLGALDPLGGLYPFLESSHGLPQPHPQGPNACLPACRDYPSAFLSAPFPKALLDWKF